MLNLIFGRAGSGKTKYAREFFRDNFSPDENKKQILIVPEQYSFETERAILEIMGEEKAQAVKVMSFSRLCEWFFRIYGGIAGERLSDGGRAVFMQMAVDAAIDKIEIYKKPAQKGELTPLLLTMLLEMKMSGVSADALTCFPENLGDEQLKGKTQEIALIFAFYDALLGQSYIDPLDDLTKMDKMLSDCDFFKASTVVIDSFSGFTAQEMQIISHMLKNADDVYITFCTDSLGEEESSVFYAAKKTAQKVIRKARENAVKVVPPVYLSEGIRFENEELKALESFIFSWDCEKYEKETENIEIYKAEDIYDESEYISAKIRSLVMEQGFRYRDIAVISRNPDAYIGVLDLAFEKRNIPYFMDKPEDISKKPIVRFVICAFEIITGGYQSADIFSYLKTGMAQLNSYEISLLENYTYIWNISGRKWFSKWVENPSGLGSAMKDDDISTLEKINELREKVITALINFEKSVEEKNGEAIALGVYHLLEETKAKEQIKNLCDLFDAQSDFSKADEQIRLWETVMAVLDQIVSTIGKRRADANECLRLFKIIFSTISIADIPQGVDEVTFGAADRIRPSNPKAVFIIGASRGDFPLAPQNSGLFSDDERKELIKAGMPIGRTFEESSFEEMFIAYLAACSASEMVFFSWPQGKSSYPSEMIVKTQKIFPCLSLKTRDSFEDEFFADSPESAFRLASKKWRENSPKAEALRKIFLEKEEYAGRIKALESAVSEKPIMISDKKIAMSLFGSSLRLSATQIETYHMCRFRYFCQFAIKAKKIEPAQINALEYGSLMHYLLEKLFLNFESKEINSMGEETLRIKIEALAKEYAKINYGGEDEKSKRFLVAIMRLTDSAYYLIRHIAKELSQSKFSPESFELEVGTQEIPMVIPMPDGRSISIVGKIDRVDSLSENEERYVRVVDYKTGAKDFKFSDILYGLNLQMLIYLAALIKNNKGKPAGVLYMPSSRPTVNMNRTSTEDEISNKIDKAFQMKGVVLNDENVLSAMEEKLEGKFIPVSIKNGKISGGEYLITEDEFKIISENIKEKLISMTLTLQGGDIDAAPLMKNKFGCDYCPYFAICGKEHSKNDVINEKLGHTDVLKILNGGEACE